MVRRHLGGLTRETLRTIGLNLQPSRFDTRRSLNVGLVPQWMRVKNSSRGQQLCTGLHRRDIGTNTGNDQVLDFHNRINQLDQTIGYMKKAVETDPHNVVNHFCLGVHYYHAKQYQEAVNSLKEAIRISEEVELPEGTWNKASCFNILGYCYTELGELMQALKSLTQAVELEPTNTIYLENLAQVSLNLRDYLKSRDNESK